MRDDTMIFPNYFVGGYSNPSKQIHIFATYSTPSAPVADFTATPLSGQVPLTVQFTDTSTNTPTSWLWSFGDGDTSNQQNPSHQYAKSGVYDVSLTATNAIGSDGESKEDYIEVRKKKPFLPSIEEGLLPHQELGGIR